LDLTPEFNEVFALAKIGEELLAVKLKIGVGEKFFSQFS